MSEIFSKIKESLTMQQVAEHFGYKVNRSGFILSPFGNEKTPSCKLYRNSYYDFSTAAGGDLIQFTAALTGSNNWQACQYLVEAFSLPYSLSGHTDNHEEIRRRQEERQREQERKQEFKTCLIKKIDELKRWEGIYKKALEKELYEPFSDMWCYCMDELQKAGYKLDTLCGSDQAAYRRMKPDLVAGLPSDRAQWLLDVLSILGEDGRFKATQEEILRIEKQRNFELCRVPEERGRKKRIQIQRKEDLSKMSDSDLVKLLGSLIAAT